MVRSAVSTPRDFHQAKGFIQGQCDGQGKIHPEIHGQLGTVGGKGTQSWHRLRG